MDTNRTAQWFDSLFRTDRMRQVFSDRGRLQGILDFEAALARAEARAGVIPAAAAAAIEGQCRAERYDIDALSPATASAGNSAIPAINALTALVRQTAEQAARYVHFGATSQDAMDTGLVLQLREALNLIENDLSRLCANLASLADAHKLTPQIGRTWLQHASPITFGLKAAGWLSALTRHFERLRAMRPRVLTLQLGSATGTLSGLGSEGLRVASLLADELHLTLPDLPWHSHRDRLVEVATTIGLLVGTLGKMARDISLLAQTEVAELAEPDEPGRGGSSSMPHKRNPVSCAAVLAAAIRVPALVSTLLAGMVQEHERGLGGWQAEWETLPEIFTLAAGALAHLNHVTRRLSVDPGRMARNLAASQGLERTEGVTAALARGLGRAAAHELMQRACLLTVADGRHLRDVLADDPVIKLQLSAEALKKLFDLQPDIQCAGLLVERALAAYRSVVAPSHDGDSRN